MNKTKIYFYLFICALLFFLVLALVGASSSVEYLGGGVTAEMPKAVHLSTPEPLKGVYMTACVAGMPSLRDKVVALIEATELNAVVVDIKDSTGTVSFLGEGPSADGGCKVTDMKDFIGALHDKQIYVIGRIAVFQDPLYTKLHPELAVKKKSDGAVWQDRKGLSFIDVGAKEYWNYIVEISKEAEKLGFDEINFDYIRYPSDGNMNDITFPHTGLSPARAGGAQTGTTTKKEMLRQFFEYLDSSLKDVPLKTSADLFGMVTTNIDDMGIGQTLENALPYFDYISPMVYPSHYPPYFNGWADPNKVPYEIVKYAMDGAVKRTEELASTTRQNFTTQNLSGQAQNQKINKNQLRPWLQDNDYPVHYT
ncbi:MAG: putative glycoside hydrolase, partial [Patescibacteria group bacterium]